MGELREVLRNNLRAIRQERDFTQEELSDRSDLAPRNVGEIERGDRELTVEDLLKLAVELEAKVSDFFVSNGQPEEHAESIDRQTYDLGTLIENGSGDGNPSSPELDTLFNTSGALLVLLNREGRIRRANGLYEALSGNTPETDRDRPFWECPLWFEANERRMKHLINEAAGGQFHREVLPVRTPKGSTRPMTVNLCPVYSGDDGSSRLLVEGYRR